jgi:Zn-dependent alcohol dehydrogenase
VADQNPERAGRSVRAAVLRSGERRLRVEDVWLEPPGPGEVRVRVAAAGVCHSDYHYICGDLTCPLPAVLGHEGAGIVEETGPGVSSVDVGDHVLFLWRAGCGRCEYCAVGRPALCGAGRRSRATGTLPAGATRWRAASGGDVFHFLGVSCFAEQTVCHESSLLRIDPAISFRLAALAGCALMSGVGAVVNTAQVRPGASVLVIGAGGVGLCAVMGARLAGARRVVAADLSADRLALAARLGATDLIDAGRGDLAAAVNRIEPGGVDHALEMIGNPATIADALACVRRGGVATVVGLAPAAARAAIPALDLVLGEKRLQGSMYGSSRPHHDYPRLFDLAARGLLPVRDLMSPGYRLDDVATAFEHMLSWQVARAVLIPDPALLPVEDE